MSRSIEDLDPRMRPLVSAFVAACAAAEIDLLITCTLRTLAEQTQLYAIGRTAPGKIVTRARAGESAHNFGFAVDVVPLVHGKPHWEFCPTDPLWARVGLCGQRVGLQWYGAPGSEFFEAAHFQFPHWKNLFVKPQSQ